MSDLPFQLLVVPAIVLVDECDQLPLRTLYAHHACSRRSLRLLEFDEHDSLFLVAVGLPEKLGCIVGGRVVHDRQPIMWIRLSEHTIDRLSYPAKTVVGG